MTQNQYPNGIEEQWRQLVLERIPHIETMIVDIQTRMAVHNVEAGNRNASIRRIEARLDEVSRLLRDVERRLDLPNPDITSCKTACETEIADVDKKLTAKLTDVDNRAMTLEKWRENLMGRLLILGTLGMVVFSVITAAIIKMINE